MRHRKHPCKLNRTSSHRRCLMANMLKSLVENGRIETTQTKAKYLKRKADKLITLAKKNTLASRRQAIAELMVRYNRLTPKEHKRAKGGDESAYNTDRKVIGKLFWDLSPKYADRKGGYTRIVKLGNRRGDGASRCLLEYL